MKIKLMFGSEYMKRLLKISVDLFLLSFIPILSYFLLGIILDKNLINIFTLTYPIQFIYYILKSIFSTGTNIHKQKDKNDDAVMSGLVTAIICACIIFGLLLYNIESYILFMNMDVQTYKIFAIYSIVLLFFQLIIGIILDKLYYEGNNTQANIYSISFNLLNFIILIGTSLITKNQVIIVLITLLTVGIYSLYILIKTWEKFKYKLNIFKCIKYDSVELYNNIAFFIIFLFGLSNALDFGEEYALALTFVALITDTQWDTFDSIATVAKIDISKNKFNYIEHRNNAYKLLGILFLTIFILFVSLYKFYDLNFTLVLIYLLFEVINFLIYPIYKIKTCYLQIEWSSLKTTTNKIISSILRMMVSLLKTPFCTGLGQITSSIYQFISLNIIFNKNYELDNKGFIIKKFMEVKNEKR